jgi:protein-S-isoprenylcysteine O-methyltransferase Ste14
MLDGNPADAARSRNLGRDLEDFAGRILMLLWFIAAIGGQGIRLIGYLSQSDSPTRPLDVAHGTLLIVFSILALALTVLRRPVKAVAAGLEPRISAILGTFLIITVTLLPPVEVDASVKIVALTLMTIGIGLSLYCLSWLGQSYSIMATARKLVTSGPYRVVRHPLYAAELLTLVGVALANFSLATVLIFLATMGFQLRRAVNEERVLRSAFPEYEQYAREVPRIIPRLPWSRRPRLAENLALKSR